MRWTTPLFLTIGALIILVALATGPLDPPRALLAVLGILMGALAMWDWERAPRKH